MKRQETFSIRKLSIGAASVLLGTFLVAGQGQVVSANEQVDEVVTLAQATDDSDSQTTVLETIEIASPVTYVADETQEVGYHEVEVAGQAGQLIISETDGVTTAERIEPTASREVYGTKPEVVEEILEKATTEYVANAKLEAGQQVVKQEGQDGKKVTTTNYRIETSFPNQISEKLLDDTYRFIDEDFYHIDKNQKLPSDQIVIDRLFVESVENLYLSTNRDDLSYRERISRNYGNVNFNGGSPTETIASVDDVTEFPTNWFLDLPEDFYSTSRAAGVGSDFPEGITDEQRYYLTLYQASYAELKYLAYGLFNDYNSDLTTRYYNNHNLSEGLYADAKADFQRLEFAKEKLEGFGIFTEGLMKEYLTIGEAFQNLTRRYNTNRGAEQLNIDYSTSDISEEDKLWLEEVIQQLPEQLRKNLVDLYVTDTEVSLGEDFVGVANYLTKRIQLKFYEVYDRYTVVKNVENNLPTVEKRDETNYRRRLREVLLHELAHIVDSTGGVSVFANAFDGSTTPIGFSGSEEFRAIYNEYLRGTQLRAYHQNSIVEAFAEGFGSYLNNRLFGTPYRRFMKVEDSDFVNYYGIYYEVQPEDAFYEQATDVWTPIKYYFDKLYTLLFEQPTTAEVVVDQITTEVIDVQQKIVEVGTKPQVVEQITTYTTIEREDAELLIGEKRVIQVGKDGIVKKTTRYELVDKITGEVVATTTSEVIQELVEEIIAVGTKVAEVVEPEVQTPTEEPSVSEPEVEVPIEETTALPTESPVEEEKPEEVVETPTEEPSTAPEITEEPSVDEPVSEPEVETPTEEATAIPSEAPVEEKKTEAVIETPTEEPSTTPEVTEEPSSEEVVTEPVVEEEISAIPDYAPEEEALPEYVFDPADFQDILEPSQEEVSDKESSSQAGGAGVASRQDKPVISTLSGIGSADRPVITATAIAPSYSRTARAAAEKSLPNTGDSSALLSLVGFGLTTLGLVGRKRRQG